MQATKPILAKAIEITPTALVLVLPERKVSIAWDKCSPVLAKASAIERQTAELSPGGYGIHWPLLDEDLTVTGLVEQSR